MIDGRKIKIKRVEQGLTQKDLAEISGIHRITICQIEIGSQNPALETAIKIAKALNCTIEEICFPDEKHDSG